MQGIQIDIGGIMVASGMVGMYLHFVIARRAKRASGNFISYLFADNPQATGITLFVFAGAMSTLFAVGSFDQLRMDDFIEALKNGYLYAPMVQGIAQAVTAGYMADSVLNKGAQ